jgi:hypothetical protein
MKAHVVRVTYILALVAMFVMASGAGRKFGG